MNVQKRLLRELKSDELPEGFYLGFVQDSDMSILEGCFPGPRDTPYEDGIFRVIIQVCSEYPFKPPQIKFTTRVFHPNISSQTGAICLNILKNEWTPSFSLGKVLLSLQQLLGEPIADDPQDAEVAKVFKSDYPTFCQYVKQWVTQYASINTCGNGVQ